MLTERLWPYFHPVMVSKHRRGLHGARLEDCCDEFSPFIFRYINGRGMIGVVMCSWRRVRKA